VRRTIEITSYAEVGLYSTAASDLMHPRLEIYFVQKLKIIPNQHAHLICTRRTSVLQRRNALVVPFDEYDGKDAMNIYEQAGEFIGQWKFNRASAGNEHSGRIRKARCASWILL